jgi:seryl-tRNA(Sec) selenium transferase
VEIDAERAGDLTQRVAAGMDYSYTALGIRPVINADATLTRLGGSRMPRQVLEAMAAAAEQFVDLAELQ